mmetsp:Transcript_78812/g.210480  ORF Transcript_78812/g.210480 Transcript_78812/m.210480 type:complete len:285 (-) Transcript_78812:526-1380(-)
MHRAHGPSAQVQCGHLGWTTGVLGARTLRVAQGGHHSIRQLRLAADPHLDVIPQHFGLDHLCGGVLGAQHNDLGHNLSDVAPGTVAPTEVVQPANTGNGPDVLVDKLDTVPQLLHTTLLVHRNEPKHWVQIACNFNLHLLLHHPHWLTLQRRRNRSRNKTTPQHNGEIRRLPAPRALRAIAQLLVTHFCGFKPPHVAEDQPQLLDLFAALPKPDSGVVQPSASHGHVSLMLHPQAAGGDDHFGGPRVLHGPPIRGLPKLRLEAKLEHGRPHKLRHSREIEVPAF